MEEDQVRDDRIRGIEAAIRIISRVVENNWPGALSPAIEEFEAHLHVLESTVQLPGNATMTANATRYALHLLKFVQ